MQQPSQDLSTVRQVMCNVLRNESESIAGLVDQVSSTTIRAVEVLHQCEGRVVVSGMGKMSAIARKMAAMLCSTGTPAIFLHPSEARHGDLGIVTQQDVFLALSNSGETLELLELIPFMKRCDVPVISITGIPDNSLSRLASYPISLGITQEADAITLAPTNSTTATLAMCDAMAIALVHMRGFTADQFAIFHPAGNIGRKLLLCVRDLMHKGDQVPLVQQDSTLRDAIVLISQKTFGAGFVIDLQNHLIGIITDGDLRRILQRHENPLDKKAVDLMTQDPITVSSPTLAAEALKIMEDHAITVLPVVGNDSESLGHVVGVLHLHDLLRAGLA